MVAIKEVDLEELSDKSLENCSVNYSIYINIIHIERNSNYVENKK